MHTAYLTFFARLSDAGWHNVKARDSGLDNDLQPEADAEHELLDALEAEPELQPEDASEADSADGVSEAAQAGRDRIERKLRQPIHVEKYHGRAGEILEQTADSEAEGYGYQRYQNDENIYAPFAHRLDWEVARWCQLRGPGSTAVSELLSIDGVRKFDYIINVANPR